MRYDFEGAAAANYSILIVGRDRQWRIDVVPISGAVQVTDVS